MFVYQCAFENDQKEIEDLVYLGEQRRRHIVSISLRKIYVRLDVWYFGSNSIFKYFWYCLYYSEYLGFNLIFYLPICSLNYPLVGDSAPHLVAHSIPDEIVILSASQH